jgi:chaperonin GroES
MFKVKPINKNIVIKVFENDLETSSGIILTQNATDKSIHAKVIAVDIEDKELRVKEGDNIYYNKYSGAEIEVDREKYLIIKEHDVLAITQ